MEYTKDDFISWRSNPVTLGFLDEVLKEMNNSVADLINNAGINPGHDRYEAGRIAGLKWLPEWQPNFPEEEEDESTSSRS